jgi:hypothetical protein
MASNYRLPELPSLPRQEIPLSVLMESAPRNYPREFFLDVCTGDKRGVNELLKVISDKDLEESYRIIAAEKQRGEKPCSSLLSPLDILKITRKKRTLFNEFFAQLIIHNFDNKHDTIIENISKVLSFDRIAEALINALNIFMALVIEDELEKNEDRELMRMEAEEKKDYDESRYAVQEEDEYYSGMDIDAEDANDGILNSLPFLSKKLDVESAKQAIDIISSNIFDKELQKKFLKSTWTMKELEE